MLNCVLNFILSDKTVETYHFGKLSKLDITQHRQCLLSSTSNLSPTSCIGASAQYWNSIVPIKDQNYTITWDFEPWCCVTSSFSNLPKWNVSTVLLSMVRDFKQCFYSSFIFIHQLFPLFFLVIIETILHMFNFSFTCS